MKNDEEWTHKRSSLEITRWLLVTDAMQWKLCTNGADDDGGLAQWFWLVRLWLRLQRGENKVNLFILNFNTIKWTWVVMLWRLLIFFQMLLKGFCLPSEGGSDSKSMWWRVKRNAFVENVLFSSKRKLSWRKWKVRMTKGGRGQGISVINLYKFCGRPKYVSHSTHQVSEISFAICWCGSHCIGCVRVNEWMDQQIFLPNSNRMIHSSWMECEKKQYLIWSLLSCQLCLCAVDDDSHSLAERNVRCVARGVIVCMRLSLLIHIFVRANAICAKIALHFFFV